MSMWVRRAIKTRLNELVGNEVRRTLTVLLPQLIEFHNSPPEDRQSHYDHTRDPVGNAAIFANLRDQLQEIGVLVEDVDIDIGDFEHWLSSFPEVAGHYSGETSVEKSLQHFLSFRHLRIARGDVYIDVGGQRSPWVSALNKRGIRSYRLDLAYREGVHGTDIGADAGDTRLPDSFASVLSVQDAFENFIGRDVDIRFVREAARILNERGRYAIVPLYIDVDYFVALSPYCDLRGISIDPKAKRLWRDDEYTGVPFSRHYSPEAFKAQVFSQIPESMKARVLYFRNLLDLVERYPGKRFVSFFMFYCEKRGR